MVRSQPPSSEQTLIDAARQSAARLTGRRVTRIVLTLDDGTKWKIDLPRSCEGQWPPAEGWGVRGGKGSFNGTVFNLAGKSLAIYRVLVDAGEGGITFDELNQSVWEEYPAEAKTVDNAMTILRKALRDALDLNDSFDPIRSERKRYWLARE